MEEAGGNAAPFCASAQNWPGVLRVTRDLQADIHRVTRVMPTLTTDQAPKGRDVVLMGTIGKSPLIDQPVRDKKRNVSGVAGKWEVLVKQLINKPLPETPSG